MQFPISRDSKVTGQLTGKWFHGWVRTVIKSWSSQIAVLLNSQYEVQREAEVSERGNR